MTDITQDQSITGTDPSNPPQQPETPPQQPAANQPSDGSQTVPSASPAPDKWQQQPSQAPPANGAQQPGMVSNAPTVGKSDPAIQHAGRFYEFAQALAGGPRYKTSIDPSTGTMNRTQVPVSRGDLGMAIALEAISGALSGLTQTGPGALGKAAAAGFQMTTNQRQQVDQQQNDKANADFARHAQVYETNLRTYQIAQTLGRADYATNVESAAQFKPLADQLQKDHPEAVKGVVNESDMSKYHVTKDTAIMTGNVVPTLDPKTGEQAKGPYGNPLWEHQYLIVDPSLKADNFLSDEDKAEAARFRLPGFADSDGKPSSLPQSIPMRLSMALNYKARIAALKLSDNDVSAYYKKLGIDAPKLPDLVQKDPTLADAMEKFQPLLNATQQNYAKAIGELGAKDPQAAGKILGLYGGTAMVNKFDQQMNDEREKAKKDTDAQAAIEKEKALLPVRTAQAVATERALIPSRAATAGAEETARDHAKAAVEREATEQGLANAQSEQPIDGVRHAYLQSLPPDQAAMIQALGEGRARLSDYSAGRKDGAQIMRQVATAYPDFDKSKVDAYYATRRTFTSGKTATGISALNTAMSHLNTMFQNIGWEATTPGVSGLAQASGYQSVTDYRTAQSQVAKEIETAYKNGALTDKDSADAKALLSASTPMEARSKAKALVHLLDGKLSAYDHQLAVSRPSTAVTPLEIMSDEAKASYLKITGSAPETGKEQAAQYRRSATSSQPTQNIAQPSALSNLHVNPQTQQQIGWDGKQWVDTQTRQPVK